MIFPDSDSKMPLVVKCRANAIAMLRQKHHLRSLVFVVFVAAVIAEQDIVWSWAAVVANCVTS